MDLIHHLRFLRIGNCNLVGASILIQTLLSLMMAFSTLESWLGKEIGEAGSLSERTGGSQLHTVPTQNASP